MKIRLHQPVISSRKYKPLTKMEYLCIIHDMSAWQDLNLLLKANHFIKVHLDRKQPDFQSLKSGPREPLYNFFHINSHSPFARDLDRKPIHYFKFTSLLGRSDSLNMWFSNSKESNYDTEG